MLLSFFYLLIALYYSLLRYNIIDTIESSSTNSRRLFNDIWDEIIDAMEVMLTPTAETETSENDVEIKDKEVKTYAKNILKNVVSKISLISLKY